MIQNDPANPNVTKLWWDIRQKNESLKRMVCHSMKTNKLHKNCSFQETSIDMLQEEMEKGFKKDHGPFVRALEKALKSFNVEREAYYSGTFVGNHVHATLKVYRTTCTLLSVVIMS